MIDILVEANKYINYCEISAQFTKVFLPLKHYSCTEFRTIRRTANERPILGLFFFVLFCFFSPEYKVHSVKRIE